MSALFEAPVRPSGVSCETKSRSAIHAFVALFLSRHLRVQQDILPMCRDEVPPRYRSQHRAAFSLRLGSLPEITSLGLKGATYATLSSSCANAMHMVGTAIVKMAIKCCVSVVCCSFGAPGQEIGVSGCDPALGKLQQPGSCSGPASMQDAGCMGGDDSNIARQKEALRL